MIKHWKYSICQLLLIICIFKRRKTEDFTSLRNQQPYCHTESHHFVTRSHDCLKMQGFYSSVQQESVKKAWFQKGFRVQRWRLFLFRVSLFFTRFHASFLLFIAVISSKRPTNKKRIILGFASLLAELKQLSVPKIGLKWTIDHGGRRYDVPNW